jgi:hypothetical protein
MHHKLIPCAGLLAGLIMIGSAMTLIQGAGADGPGSTTECLPGGGGGLEMEISGEFDASIDWSNRGTQCDGGPRPEGDALRLMFSRDDEGLLIVLAITGLERGSVGDGMLANLTIVRQGAGLFYGSLGADACLVDVAEHVAEDGLSGAYRVSGKGRCEAPIEAIARAGEIRVAPFAFTGKAHWPDEDD